MKKAQKFYLMLCILLRLSAVMQAQPGSLDSSFNGTGVLRYTEPGQGVSFERVIVQPDGNILAIGNTNPGIDIDYASIAHRFLPDGSHDLNFAENGIYQSIPDLGRFYCLDGMLEDEGRILLFSNVGYNNSFAITRLLADGTTDVSFDQLQYGTAYSHFDFLTYYGPIFTRLVRQTDHKLVAFGTFADYNTGVVRGLITRFLPNGMLDSSFNQNGILGIYPESSNFQLFINGGKVLPDGRIIAIGSSGNVNGNANWYLTRLMPDGSLDPSFGTGGIVKVDLGALTPESGVEIVLLPDGKFLAGGFAQKLPGEHFTVLRFLSNGKLDNTFGFAGKAQIAFNCCYSFLTDLVVQPDGKILTCGFSRADDYIEKFSLARFNSNGSIDQSFGNQGKKVVEVIDKPWVNARATSLALQSDGKILVSGLTDTIFGGFKHNIDAYLVRLNGDTKVETKNPDEGTNFDLFLFPNPVSSGELQLSYSLSSPADIDIQLFDLYGRKIAEPIVLGRRLEGRQSETLHLPASLSGGSYLLALRTDKGIRYSKFVVDR